MSIGINWSFLSSHYYVIFVEINRLQFVYIYISSFYILVSNEAGSGALPDRLYSPEQELQPFLTKPSLGHALVRLSPLNVCVTASQNFNHTAVLRKIFFF